MSAHAYVRERTGVSGDINGRAKMINVTVAVTVTNESFMNVVNKRQLLVTPIYSKNVLYNYVTLKLEYIKKSETLSARKSNINCY